MELSYRGICPCFIIFIRINAIYLGRMDDLMTILGIIQFLHWLHQVILWFPFYLERWTLHDTVKAWNVGGVALIS